jgi:hypothetical protein
MKNYDVVMNILVTRKRQIMLMYLLCKLCFHHTNRDYYLHSYNQSVGKVQWVVVVVEIDVTTMTTLKDSDRSQNALTHQVKKSV